MTKSLSWSGYDDNNPAHQALKDFLTLDLQQNPARVQSLLDTIEQIRLGQSKNWQGGGNAYFCHLDSHGAQLEIAVDDIDERPLPIIELDCVVKAATAWLKSIGKFDLNQKVP